MKKIIFYLVTLFCIITICPTLKINAAASWQTANFTKTQIGDGVYLEYYRGTSKSDFNSTTQANGRYQDIYTINMDKDTTAKVVVWGKSGNSNSWGVTTLEDISRDYEAKHPDKMVIAATNNWLADTQANNRGELDAVQVIGGLNYRVSDKQGTTDTSVAESFGHGYIPRPNMLGFDMDGNAYFTDDWNNGENYTTKLQLSFYIDEENKEPLNLSIDKINEEPNDGEIAILFPNYNGNNTMGGTIYQMSSSKLRYDFEEGVTTFKERDAFALGTFVKTVNEISFTDTTKQTYYIISKNESFDALDIENKLLLAQYELLGDYKDVVGATTYYFHIVRNGEAYPGSFGAWNEINCEVHPRTAFVIKEDGSYALSVIDGRRAGNKTGMDYQDMANFYKTNYQAKEVFNYDGGGSSCLIVRTRRGDFQIVNAPSDGSERGVANATLVVVDRDPFTIKQVGYGPNKLELGLENVKEQVKTVYAKMTTKGYEKELAFDANGSVLFTDLESNKEYEIAVTYELLDGTRIDGEYYYGSTSKRYAEINKFDINNITKTSVNIDIELNDIDDVFSFAYVELGAKKIRLTTISKSITFDNLEPGKTYEIKFTVINNVYGQPDEVIYNYNFETLQEQVIEPIEEEPQKPKKGCKSGSLVVFSLLGMAVLLIIRKNR